MRLPWSTALFIVGDFIVCCLNQCLFSERDFVAFVVSIPKLFKNPIPFPLKEKNSVF
jgi:hypothetical protein